MKTKFLFLILFITSFCFGQNTIVKYMEYREIGDQSNVSFLIYNENNSYNIQSFIDLFENYEELLADKKFVEDLKYFRSIKKENIYTNDYFGVTNILRKGNAIYKDVVPKIEWELSDKESIILGYHCKLATAKFRGREYKVWYTLEIPVPIGPWKLGGLPGLILKADADNGSFTFEATSIILNTSLEVPEKYVKLYENNMDKISDYPIVIEMENKALEEFRQEQIANLPKDVNLTYFPPIRKDLIEVIFDNELQIK